jgi:hypothetical protein
VRDHEEGPRAAAHDRGLPVIDGAGSDVRAEITRRNDSEQAEPTTRTHEEQRTARLVDFLPHSGERVPTAYELHRDYKLVLLREREQHGAAPMTIEALMVGFRAKGVAHLQEPNCRRRMAELSAPQHDEIIRRLIHCRMTYPGRDRGVSDKLLLVLKGLFDEAA